METINTSQLFYYVKWAAIIQLLVLLSLVLIAYFLRAYYAYKKRLQNKKRAEIEELLVKMSAQPSLVFSDKAIKLLQDYVPIDLELIPKLDQRQDLLYWENIKNQLVHKVLTPRAQKMASSKHWLDRYYAVMSFQYDLDIRNQPYLLPLIKDKIFLVSINAAKVALHAPNKESINTIIDTYAKGRKMQQATFSEILAKNETNSDIVPLVCDRLEHEKDPYVKTFCYRLLERLPDNKELSRAYQEDVKSDNRDLKIAALEYLSYYPSQETMPLIRQALNDPSWEVRTVAAKLLGKLQDTQSIPEIAELLNDQEWWVRGNAANALYNMGEEGIEVLKAQSSDTDPLAYETSQYVLNTAKE
jgi:hypothetical protein